jgi:hypothetical protein
MHQKPRLKKVEAFVLIEDWEAMLASGIIISCLITFSL